MKSKIFLYDDFYVASRPGTVRRYFKPERIGEYLDGDLLQTYTTFFYDTRVGKYRLYYEVPKSQKSTEIRKLLMAEGDTVEDFVTGNVKKYEIEGLDEDGIHGCSVLLCTHEGRVSNYVLGGNFRAHTRATRCMFTAKSEDGIHFTDMRKIHEDYSDAYNSVYYNPHTEEYVMTMRATIMDRRIFAIRSKDFEQWSRPQMILHPNADANNGVQLYCMGVNQLDGMFYGLTWRFMTDLGRYDATDMYGYMDCDLYYSYDGECFMPTGLAPVADRPLPPLRGCKQLWFLNTCHTTDDRTVICGGASSMMHGGIMDQKKPISTVFYGIRKDGFCAIEGLGKTSTVYLKRFVCDGGDLLLNCNARLGRITVAILDDKGNPYEGFDFADCVAIENEESVDRLVQWKNASLASLAGKTFRVAIRLDGAFLYTVTLDGRPCQRHPQISLGNASPVLPIDHSYD